VLSGIRKTVFRNSRTNHASEKNASEPLAWCVKSPLCWGEGWSSASGSGLSPPAVGVSRAGGPGAGRSLQAPHEPPAQRLLPASRPTSSLPGTRGAV